jgi:ABC-type branched-subunit amino acid transport system substrate-binding protein
MKGSSHGTLRVLVICLWLFLLPASAHCAGEDIVIGMSAAFRGPTRGLGIELYRGAMAYIDHVNNTGGIDGRKIIVQAYVDGYNPIPAIENTIKLIETDNVLLLFSYLGTPTVTRVLPLLRNYSNRGVLLFFPFTGAEPHRQPPYDKYVFNLRASYAQEVGGLVDNFVKIGRTRIAVFYQVDAYGRSGWNGVREALAKYGLRIVGEATYRRGMKHTDSLKKQVEIIKRSEPDAIISISTYGAGAAFIRDARDAGLTVPIANVSFVGTEFLIDLLVQTSAEKGRDYTAHLVNSQVVPSYEDTSLPAVREYRALMKTYNPMPPAALLEEPYSPLEYSFVSFEGFLNAKLLVKMLRRFEGLPDRDHLRGIVESTGKLDIGIDTPVSFGKNQHQGLDRIYYTTVSKGRVVPLASWEAWRE